MSDDDELRELAAAMDADCYPGGDIVRAAADRIDSLIARRDEIMRLSGAAVQTIAVSFETCATPCPRGEHCCCRSHCATGRWTA